ncbi:hypothetical protein [Clostridium botulinum]|uniref:hypothetical protein n=1 Tax=Clostridium botulinum TaxID=1491 RepID=UPI001C9AA2AF|nr:hypothetical protein [Clostridium botulinum]MBY6842870.1 hypothetical protein [Clostridium botulinum]
MIYEVDKTKFVHDTWENDWYSCPNCRYECIDIGFHYCPNCGEGLNCGLLDENEEE